MTKQKQGRALETETLSLNKALPDLGSILICEENDLVRVALKHLIQHSLGTVTFGEAKTCQEALDQFQRDIWNLVFLDITLPGCNGLELLLEFKAIRPETSVLILSVLPEEENAMRSFKSGASGYINKGSLVDELMVALRKVLAGGRYVSPKVAENLSVVLDGEEKLAVHETLSERELQILKLIAKGKSIKEMAVELSLSDKTVSTYRTRICQKTRLCTNVAIARYAVQHRLVD